MELNWNTYLFQDDNEEGLAHQLADCIRKEAIRFHGVKSAVYLLTNTAGSNSSVQLWANALEHSPRFANPNMFPWTLANATAGYIAREFLIEGPNYTIVSKDLDLNEILEIYHQDKYNIALKSALFVIWQYKHSDSLTVDVQVGYTLV
ncbi:hypothetical protein FGM00_13180 [Aggregatimonas sangjinii]|uniref:Beta-ketoacyl synthase N-terminal domain-containing protein n=1 Tax=Aggregatimonas sangjinii TaxID=2583587 RepID=A0A5B7SVI4_9FLAO|nr:hypothetical protein [Aggregatimonas sangjinii]QCX01018.1 hypothetical protein FGM00_13180 [Aggregatimonas sangjinii]